MLRTVNHGSRTGDHFRRLKGKGEDGASLFEYAMIFMFFLALLLGIMNFGHALYAYHFVNNAAKEATRYAAVRGFTCNNDANASTNDPGSCQASNSASGTSGPTTQTDIQQFVTNITPPGINTDPTKLVATVTWPQQTNSPPACISGGANFIAANYPGCTVQVQVTYTFTLLFPVFNNNPLTLSSTSQMVIAH